MFRHISYEEELRVKHKWVYDHIKKFGKMDIEPLPVLSTYHIDEYRNKAQYPVKKDKDGAIQFFRALFITPFKAGYGFFYNEEGNTKEGRDVF